MAYHSKGISKNKKIREQRRKPLPLELMKSNSIINHSEINKLLDNVKLMNNPLIIFEPDNNL